MNRNRGKKTREHDRFHATNRSSKNTKCMWCERVGEHGKYCGRPKWYKVLESEMVDRYRELERLV